MKRKKDECTEAFYSGVICALLVVVDTYGEDSLACEILTCCDVKEVRRIAKREGDASIVKLVDNYRRDRRWKNDAPAPAAKKKN